jgi:nicotinamide-nucleotide amidase
VFCTLVSLVNPHIQQHCLTLANALIQQKLCMTTAESCTGGMIASSCTNLSGSSAWFERGFVTYSNEAKTDMLGVPTALIAQHGAVSEEVARAMALGALAHSKADYSVAVTGIAGPTGGSDAKPVGTVWLAWAVKSSGKCVTLHKLFPGDRQAVREATTELALAHFIDLLSQR